MLTEIQLLQHEIEHVVVGDVALDRVETILEYLSAPLLDDGSTIRRRFVFLNVQMIQFIVGRENGFDDLAFPTAVVTIGIGGIQLEQLRELHLAVLAFLSANVLNRIVEIRHGRIHRSGVVGGYTALLTYHEGEEVGELAAVTVLVLGSRLFKQAQNLVGIDVVHALGFVDFHARQNCQLADLIVQRHQGIEVLSRHQAIPE